MTKNEIVARFTGYTSCATEHDTFWNYPSEECRIDNWRFHSNGLAFDRSYDWLMPAWVKFKDLKFDDAKHEMQHPKYVGETWRALGFKTITEAFDELVKGIEWYNSLNK